MRWLLVGRGGGIFFDGGTEFVELAIVLAVFWSDAFGNRLRTFKLRAGIKEAALFAAVEFGVALRAGALGIKTRSKDCAAIGAAGASDRADHARGAGAEMIVLSARATLGRFAFGASFLFFVGIAIAAMTVLTIHKILRTLARTLTSM